MRVLVLEGRPGAAADAAAVLEQAGHEVSRCHDEGAAPFPCQGMVDHHACPLDATQVDVALVVRDAPGDEPTAGEDGVRCALRRHIPVVVAGDTSRSPYVDWAAVVEEDVEAIPVAVEVAAAAPLRRHTEAARRSLRAVLEHHGVDGTAADAEVTRVGGDLLVTLRPGTALETFVAEMASVRAVGAVRDIDPYPRVIDVTIVTPD